MKTYQKILCVVVLTSSILIAGTKKYGKAISMKEKTSISAVLKNPEEYKNKKIRVEGVIVDVCKERGCWIKISGENKFESIRFKVDDGVIVFPLDIKGKNVIAEGVLSVKSYTKEELIEQGKNSAKEEGKSFDPSTVTGPKTVIQLKGEGAEVQ